MFLQENLTDPTGRLSGSISTRWRRSSPTMVPLVLCPNQRRMAFPAGSWAACVSAPASTRRERGDKCSPLPKRRSHKTLRVKVKFIDYCCSSIISHSESGNAVEGPSIFLTSHLHSLLHHVNPCVIGLQRCTGANPATDVFSNLVTCRLFGPRITPWPGTWRRRSGRIQQGGLWISA